MIGVKKVFDLRSIPEIQRDGPEWAGVEVDKPDVFAPYGIERDWQPVFATKDYSPDQVSLRYQQYVRSGFEGFVNAYRDIMTAGAPAYGTILRHLAQAEPTACIVHCTAGKDRTGVIVALILLLLEVPREEICKEYALTDKGLESLKPLFLERLMKNPALGGDKQGIFNMISSKAENMNATIDMIDTEFGGAEKYVREYCKLTDAEVEALKKNLHA